MPKGYFMIEVEVVDWDGYNKYRLEGWKTIAQYGGQYVVRGDDPTIVEGDTGRKVRTTIVEFPSVERMMEWYNSPEYRRIRGLRVGATKTKAWAMAGVESPVPGPSKMA